MPLPQPLTPRPRTTLSRTAVGAGVGLLALMLATSTLAAKPGAVLTRDNRDYFGDITSDSMPDGPVTIVVTLASNPPTPPQPIQIKRANIERVTYFNSAREEFDYRTARAGKLAAAHVATARWAIAQNEPEWARQSLAKAKALQPSDRSVQQLEADLNKARNPATPPAATQPATPGTSPAAPPVGPAGAPKRPKAAIRMLTADEINALRQLEWKGDKQVTVKIDPDLRKRYIDLAGITNARAKQMTPQDMAWEILQTGTPDMKRDLKLITDPQPLREWRSNINNKIIGTNTGCAAAACHHPQNKAGDFVLFHGNGEAEGLTNFVIVNQFYKDIERPKEKPQQFLMIDRTQPMQSLLLHYALPANMTEVPHPEVKGYNGVIRNRGDKNYGTLVGWITESLSAIPPAYDKMFDLTTEPKEQDKTQKGAPAKAADAPVKAGDAPARAGGPPARIPPIGGGPGPNGLPGRQARPPQ